MKLSGLNIRKAIELDLPVEEIFQISKKPEGDIAAKEMYEDKITHSSEIENIEEIFGEGFTQFYCEPKKEIKINKNLKAYIYNFYLCGLLKKDLKNSKIQSEKSLEISFINTKTLSYSDFLKNIMDAHSYLGKFPKNNFKRRFSGIGSFNMEDYVSSHHMCNMSDVHFTDFFIKDSNLVSTISNIITARYENDIIQQREYFNEDEYYKMLDTVKRHQKIISSGYLKDEMDSF
tara:strand:- start:468 stop:1163 length:696 start_codon:yes stop_codon:yes gene_type:complete